MAIHVADAEDTGHAVDAFGEEILKIVWRDAAGPPRLSTNSQWRGTDLGELYSREKLAKLMHLERQRGNITESSGVVPIKN